MREEVEEGSWFARWEEQLPSPDELMPLSQTLITPDLALAFDIPAHHHARGASATPPPPPPAPPPPAQQPLQAAVEYEAAEIGGGGGGDEPARTLKRPRLVWTPQLHKRFVDAVAHLGIKNAVPKTIMQLMSVDGLTRENVASHLQKYRLYLKRMQGLSSSSASPSASAGGAISAADHQLFASAPVPHHFLARGGGGGSGADSPFAPYAPVVALHHHQQMAAVQQQHQYYHQRHAGHFGSPPAGFDPHGLLSRAATHPGMHGMVVQVPPPVAASAAAYVDDLESGPGGGATRRVLTLFPTGDE